MCWRAAWTLGSWLISNAVVMLTLADFDGLGAADRPGAAERDAGRCGMLDDGRRKKSDRLSRDRAGCPGMRRQGGSGEESKSKMKIKIMKRIMSKSKRKIRKGLRRGARFGAAGEDERDGSASS